MNFYEEIKGKKVVTDSRECEKGCVFFALKGEKADGHDYIFSAVEKGAEYVVVSKLPERPIENAKIIQVDDTYEALKYAVRAHLQAMPLKAKVAITGSVGKTSTRDLCFYALKSRYKVARSIKNYNNEVGLPLSILSMPLDTEVAIIEMGMSDKGTIAPLAELVRPDMVIITLIGVNHIEYLKTREGIFEEKLSSINYFRDGCTLIVNGDCDMLTESRLSDRVEKLGGKLIICGSENKEKSSFDYTVSSVKDSGRSVSFDITGRDGVKYPVDLPIAGGHNAVNAALAMALSEKLGVTIPEAAKSMKETELTGRRLKIYDAPSGFTIIEDCYNAAPDSMKSALRTLAGTETGPGGVRVAVLGDMLELGDKAKDYHREIGDLAKALNIDEVLTLGELAGEIKPSMHFPTKQALSDFLRYTLYEGDVVLFKASRGMKFEKIIKDILQ